VPADEILERRVCHGADVGRSAGFCQITADRTGRIAISSTCST
jgi:hypothetical protein